MVFRNSMLPVVLAVFCTFVDVPSAQAEQAVVDVVRDANAAFEAGQFYNAVILYRRAYKMAEDPRILYRLGVAYEKLNNFRRAREHMELYLLAEPDSEYAERVRNRIQEIKTQEHQQAFVTLETVEPGAAIYINEDEVSEGRTPLTVPVGFGHVKIRLVGASVEMTDTLEVGAAQTVKRVYDLQRSKLLSSMVEARAQQVEDPVVTSLPMTYVSIAPPPSVNVIGFGAMSLGWVGTVGGALLGDVRILSGGVAAFAVGGYLIFVHDWSQDLPDAVDSPVAAPQTVSTPGFQVGF